MLEAQDRSPKGPAHLLPPLRPACHLYRRALLGPASLPSPPLCRQMSLPRESPGASPAGQPSPAPVWRHRLLWVGEGRGTKTRGSYGPAPLLFP